MITHRSVKTLVNVRTNIIFFSPIISLLQGAIFYFLSVVAGIPLAFLWGISFALLHYVIIWFVQPALVFLFVCVRVTFTPLTILTRLALDPIFQSAALVLQNVRFEGRVTSRPNAQTVHDVRRTSSIRAGTEWLGFV